MLKRSKDNDNSQEQSGSQEAETGKDTAQAGDLEVQTEAVDAVLTPRSDYEKLEAQIAEKDRELTELKDRYLRTVAETDNIRKRIRQQSEESVRLQRENFLRDLLPIVDNLERAVEAARGGGNGKSILEGVEMTLRSLLDFLKSHGVTQMSAVGQQFDPQLHEAVDQIEDANHPPNTVVNEFHRGYLIGDRMLRPARVSVASSSRNGSEDKGNGES
jgi:molecular chaperone GrpE